MVRIAKPPPQYGSPGGGGSPTAAPNTAAAAADSSTPNNTKTSGVPSDVSYISDTSSITNPVELGFSYSQEDVGNDDISFIDSATSALTGLTGWTSALTSSNTNNNVPSTTAVVHTTPRKIRSGRSAGSMGLLGLDGGDVSELDGKATRSINSYKSSNYSNGAGEDYGGVNSAYGSVSELGDTRISAFSFDRNGSVETSLDEIDVSSGYHKTPNKNNTPSRGRSPSTQHQYGKKANPSYRAKPKGMSNDDSSVFSTSTRGSTTSKKRAPVPPLRDPTMDDTEEDQMWEEDCNYDINPTLLFLVLESHDWKESISLLDGKGLENKNEAWNLGKLFAPANRREQEKDALMKKRKVELRAQSRTWIIRREKNGVLRWRMLPLHAALAFNAPFEVVLRLYHLYPGAVRCRNDQGMLPLHHCFKYGNEDKILELLLDVFPEALTVLDDKGRLPLACTPQDGSDNERRSNILKMFSSFQVTMAMKEEPAVCSAAEIGFEEKSQASLVAKPTMEKGDGCLGAAPRYTTNTDYNQVTYNSIAPAATKTQRSKPSPSKQRPEDDEFSISDKYATENGENMPLNGALGGLLTIPEDEAVSSEEKKALQTEKMVLGEKKKGKRRGLFSKKKKKSVQI